MNSQAFVQIPDMVVFFYLPTTAPKTENNPSFISFVCFLRCFALHYNLQYQLKKLSSSLFLLDDYKTISVTVKNDSSISFFFFFLLRRSYVAFSYFCRIKTVSFFSKIIKILSICRLFHAIFWFRPMTSLIISHCSFFFFTGLTVTPAVEGTLYLFHLLLFNPQLTDIDE